MWETMRQVFISGHGGPRRLQLRDAPDPQPGTRELRVRVHASGINFADILARRGLVSLMHRSPVCGRL